MVVTAEEALIAVAFGKLKVALLIVAVPEPAPKAKVVAAPPTLRVVAVELNRLPVVLVVERVPPLTATFPAVVLLPEDPVMEKLVAETLVAPRAKEVSIVEDDRSKAVVTWPPEVPATLKATGRALSTSLFWIRTSSLGSATPAPSALENLVSPVEPVAVVIVRLESVAVSAKVKARSRLLVVVMVLPPLYADCKVTVLVEHLVTLSEPSTQSSVPAEPGVVNPGMFRKESASVTIETPFVPEGVKVDWALAAKAPLDVNVPVKVPVPVTARLLLIVVVPVEAPTFKVVAAPPTFKVVAPVLNRFPVVLVVVT